MSQNLSQALVVLGVSFMGWSGIKTKTTIKILKAGLKQSIHRGEVVGEDFARAVVCRRIRAKGGQAVAESREGYALIVDEGIRARAESGEGKLLRRGGGEKDDVLGLARREGVDLRKDALQGFVERSDEVGLGRLHRADDVIGEHAVGGEMP